MLMFGYMEYPDNNKFVLNLDSGESQSFIERVPCILIAHWYSESGVWLYRNTPKSYVYLYTFIKLCFLDLNLYIITSNV